MKGRARILDLAKSHAEISFFQKLIPSGSTSFLIEHSTKIEGDKISDARFVMIEEANKHPFWAKAVQIPIDLKIPVSEDFDEFVSNINPNEQHSVITGIDLRENRNDCRFKLYVENEKLEYSKFQDKNPEYYDIFKPIIHNNVVFISGIELKFNGDMRRKIYSKIWESQFKESQSVLELFNVYQSPVLSHVRCIFTTIGKGNEPYIYFKLKNVQGFLDSLSASFKITDTIKEYVATLDPRNISIIGMNASDLKDKCITQANIYYYSST